MPKKVVANKRPRGSSSSDFNHKRFVSADVEARFNDSVTRRSGLREQDFDLDIENPRVECFKRVIKSQGWQMFCKHPKAAAMIVVHKFYMKAWENTPTSMALLSGRNRCVMMQCKYTSCHLTRLLWHPTPYTADNDNCISWN